MLISSLLLLLALSASALPAPLPSSPSLSRRTPASTPTASTGKVFAGEQTVLGNSETTTSKKKGKTTTSKGSKTTTTPETETTDESKVTTSPSIPPQYQTQPVEEPYNASKITTGPIASYTPPYNTRTGDITPLSMDPSGTRSKEGVAVVTVDVTFTPEPPSPTGKDNGARVFFPTSLNFWVIDALAVVQWAPALPVEVDIKITHEDTKLLPYPITLSTKVPVGFTSMPLTVMKPAAPGTGYQLVLSDSGNGTIYSKSEIFELKKAGSSVQLPAGYAASTQSSQSAGTRLVPWTAGCLLLGAVALWL